MKKAYQELLEVNVPSREADALLGASRTTMNRKPRRSQDEVRTAPPNKLSNAERTLILATLNSSE